jgi:hypothetical protein
MKPYASIFATAAFAPADTPISGESLEPRAPTSTSGNGQDTTASPIDLDTVYEQHRGRGSKAKANPEAVTESGSEVKVAYKPPPFDPLLFNASRVDPLEEGPDPFDPKSLRIDPISIEGIGERVLTEGQIGVRKPHKREFFQLHFDPTFREMMAVIILKEEMNATYLVEPRLVAGLMREISFVTLSACINVGGNVFLWPVPAPTNERRQNQWHVTAREAAKLALEHWVRMVPDMEAGCYAIFTGADNLAQVAWPKGKTLRDLIKLAFGEDGVIRDKDHPLLKRLRGQRV